MRQLLFAALAAVGLLIGSSTASAQTIAVSPVTGQTYVQYYTPYTYGSTAYYYYPNTSYMYSYPTTTYYAPGYVSSYPYTYGSYYGYYPYGTYYRPGWRMRGWGY